MKAHFSNNMEYLTEIWNMVKEVNNFITQNFYVRVAWNQQHINNANRIPEN